MANEQEVSAYKEVSPNQFDVDMTDALNGSPWAALEAHPGVFTELASQIGIKGVEVAEVFSLDSEDLKAFEPIHGLIFLFEWYEEDTKQSKVAAQSGGIPANIFFINQVVPNACATQALLSIALNSPGIELDPSLVEFKQFCSGMSPAMRGLALSGFQRLRVSHNSFARQTDMPTLYYPVPQKMEYKKRVVKRFTPVKDNGCIQANTHAKKDLKSEDVVEGKSKGFRRNKKRKQDNPVCSEADDKVGQRSHADNPAQSQYHFIGYIPIDGAVWELDGLKRMPKKLGKVPTNGDCWTSTVVPVIQKRMNSCSIEFNLLALIEDRIRVYERKRGLINAARTYLDTCTSKNKRFSSVDFASLISGIDLLSEKISMPTVGLDLQSASKILDKVDCILTSRLKDEAEKRKEFKDENVRRRFNYAPFIRKWFETMVKNGSLEAMIE
ncbi:hypothetical protein BSLG_009981 [Batrachochytrium salamandrivorans]|nr:hypothetical protein BSLG_009981 [Batrachochytrium salamandrivorans]